MSEKTIEKEENTVKFLKNKITENARLSWDNNGSCC